VSVDRSSVWPYDENGAVGEFFYQRYAHPTGVAAERALGRLDGGHALLFASGTAAIHAVALALLRPGATVALAEGCYFGTGGTLRLLEPWGLRVVEYDQTGPPPAGADLLWTEAPSNPFLTMPDLAAAAAHPGLLVCDSTAATPIHLRPLEHGADVVVHSATKYLGGHSDLLLGVAVCRDEQLLERIRLVRNQTGGTATPDAAAALLRSLKTLRLRVERQTATARELAARLAAHPAVERVRYPGFGGLLSFDVAAEQADAVETGVRLIKNMTSLGGVESSLESRWRWEGDRVPRGLLRLSVGLEDLADLWQDLAQALGRRTHDSRT
jgi:cystathionine gamma-synthase